MLFPIVVVAAFLTLPLWKPMVYRTKWGIVAANVYQDSLRRTGIVRGQINDPYTSSRSDNEIPATVRRIDELFRTYVEFGGLDPQAAPGMHVLEIGPGNTIGVPLRFVAAGAARAVAVDRFVPLQDTPFHRRLYSALRETLDQVERGRLDEAIRITDRLELQADRLRYVSGRGIQDPTVFSPDTFDVIVSTAVLQEVYDSDSAFRAMDRILKPGGRMVHIIDLRDYGIFTKHGFHPLEFLTVPEWIYRHMAEAVGQPNRRLVSYYRETLSALGYHSTIYVTWITGAERSLPVYKTSLEKGVDYSDEAVALVREVRPRLLGRYRGLSDEDLLTASILLVARKPPAATNAEVRPQR